jgi:hypothetical protein
MGTYHIKVNEQMEMSRSVLAFLQPISQVAIFEVLRQEQKPKSELYDGLNSAFAEVKLIMDGKKKRKSAQEFLEEMRKEKANELLNRND